MARTVVAIYENFQSANEAVRDLVDNGFPRNSISLVANDEKGNVTTASNDHPADDSIGDDGGKGAGVGAGIGAALGGIGGLLIGLGALVIPGLGPVLAVGPLAIALSTLTGAGVGAVTGGVTGGLLGALIGVGVPEDQAEYYAEGVRRGGILVTVMADEYNADQISLLLNHHHPMNLSDRIPQWRESGWKAPYRNNMDTSNNGDKEMSIPSVAAAQGNIPPILMTNNGVSVYPLVAPTITAEPEIASFDETNAVYQQHYQTTLASSGYDYEYYLPAYRYGHQMRTDPRFENHPWNEVEADMRQDWEAQQPNTWDRFQSSIRQAWEERIV